MWAPTVCPHAIPSAHTAIQKSNNPLHKAVDRLLCHLMPCDGCLTKNKDLQKTRVSPPMHLTNRLPAPAGPATSQLRVVRAVRSHQPSLRKERALLAQASGQLGQPMTSSSKATERRAIYWIKVTSLGGTYSAAGCRVGDLTIQTSSVLYWHCTKQTLYQGSMQGAVSCISSGQESGRRHDITTRIKLLRLDVTWVRTLPVDATVW
jgi:hypothetical protein